MVLFSREQIYVSGEFTGCLKEWQKALLRWSEGNVDLPLASIVEFSRDWFVAHDNEQKARLAREEAWRAEWGGRKGQVKELFDQFDANGDGSLTFEELENALSEFTHFFGFSVGEHSEHVSDWMQEEADMGRCGAKELFAMLDADGSGEVSFEEFWETISTWLDSGFNAVEDMRTNYAESKAEAARVESLRRANSRKLRLEADEQARVAAEAEAEARRRQQKAADELAAAEKARRDAEQALIEKERAAIEREKRLMAETAMREGKARERLLAEEEERKRKHAEEVEQMRAARAEAARAAELEAKAAAEAAAQAAEAARLAAEEAEKRRLWEQAVADMLSFASSATSSDDIAAEVVKQMQAGEPCLEPDVTAVGMYTEDGQQS